VSNEVLYTTGGIVANDRPPKCKYTHGTSDFVYWANGTEVSETGADLDLLPQRVWQSKRGDPDSVPPSFYTDLDAPVTAISSVRSIPIAFTENKTSRLDGSYDDLGRGGIIPKNISDSVGCVSHNSCVQTDEGVFFAGSDGFYYTDGYQVVPLSSMFKDSYAALVATDLRKKRIYGAFDLNERRVLWTTWKSSGEPYDDDCAQIYCLDLGKKCFNTWSSGFPGSIDTTTTNVSNTGAVATMSSTSGIDTGAYAFRNDETKPLARGSFVQDVESTSQITLNYAAQNVASATYLFVDNEPENTFFRNFLPTALLFANNKMFYGDRHGYTLYFDKDQPDDVWLDPAETLTPENFDKLPIYHSYKGSFLDFGTTEFRKWVSMILTKARPRIDINAEMTLQIRGENDDNNYPHDLEPIFFEQFYPWGTDLLSYGDPRLYRVRRSIIDVKRHFPANKLRCEYKQVQYTPAFVKVYQSSIGEVTVAAAAGDHLYTATLPSGKEWADDVYNYWILFDSDDYTAQYRIVSRDSNTQITFHDPTDTVVTGADIDWVIKGLRKQALVNLLEYSLFYEVLGPSQTQYQGENEVSS
jgi:hypothetical protein